VRIGSPRHGFDGARPRWLADPDFVPVDIEAVDLVHPHDVARDVNRPEFGANVEDLDFGPARFPDVRDDDTDRPYGATPPPGSTTTCAYSAVWAVRPAPPTRSAPSDCGNSLL
jgi:hypothetical protein